uniref:Serine protease 3 n=1 Tax=Heterololigo bleekeri TaxID=1423826 RepID=D2KX89_HETBL|nr:serine protease 3 [Heterololigo bleekeri]
MAWIGLLLLTILYSEIQASPVSHIVGGTLAKNCEFPHIAFLYIRKGQGTFSCGGSLIDDTHIVTAAHCVHGDIISVHALFGSLNMRYMNDIIPVATYTPHSQFHTTRQTVLNDVAVLTLSRPVTFSKCKKPIRMIKPNERVSSNCVVAGWGKTDTNSRPSDNLRRTDVPIMPLNSCSGMVPGITSQHVCVGTARYFGNSACKGDSGGPLMCKSLEDGERVLVGLVSYGWTCREGLGIFTSVAYFKQWIDTQVTQLI